LLLALLAALLLALLAALLLALLSLLLALLALLAALLPLLLLLLLLLLLPLREALLLPATRPAPVVVVELRPTGAAVPPPAPFRSSGGGAIRSSRHLWVEVKSARLRTTAPGWDKASIKFILVH